MHRSQHTDTIRKVIDKKVRKELVRQIDKRLDECEKHPLHTLLLTEDDICIETIAEQVLESESFTGVLEALIAREVDMRFDAVKDERIEARKEKEEEREYQASHMPVSLH